MERSAELLIGNGRLITQDERLPYLENGCVAVRDGLIAAVGPTAELRHAHRAARFVDAQGGLILPGLINTHTHLYSAFARGLALKDAAPANFVEILERLWWRLDKALTLDAVYWSAMVGMLDSIRNGVTTIFDHHSSPNAVTGSLLRIAEAACLTGVRSCLCYEVSDRDGAESAARGIAENRAHLEFCAKSENHLLRGLVGMHASFTLSDRTLDQCVGLAAEFGAGCHVHTAEAAADVEACEREHGKRIVERWRDFGVLGPKTIAAHCVHVDEHEMELLAASHTNVAHNPESNMGNAVGAAPVEEMMRLGVRVGLGTDGYTADMFESMRTAHLLARHASGNPGTGWCRPQQMLFRANAAIASESFGMTIGKLVPGAVADVIVTDYAAPTPVTTANLRAHLLFGMSGRAVKTTVIGGEVLMEDRVFLTIDEREVITRASAMAAEVWARF